MGAQKQADGDKLIADTETNKADAEKEAASSAAEAAKKKVLLCFYENYISRRCGIGIIKDVGSLRFF